jgi:hypothetical protein
VGTGRGVVLNFFFQRKISPPLFLPFVVTFPPEVKSLFFSFKKSNGKTHEFVGDEDINAVVTIIWGNGKGSAGGGLNHRDGDLAPGLLQTSFRTE